MLNIIPEQYRTLAMVVVLAVVASLSASGGAAVATWRAELACATKVGELEGKLDILRDKKHELELAIAKQNEAIAVAEALTDAARQAHELAEQRAKELAAFSKSRMEKLERAIAGATSCDEVLREYWELRK